MSYLKFEKALMTNLQESLPRELLRTNRSGAYSCSTIVECNTRKYHGLLVVPVPQLDDDNHVLLSSLDCTVVQHGAEFNLGLHKYQGNNFSPKGHKYIQEFDCAQVPTTVYRVGGVILKKEVVFQHYADRILIRYTLVDAHSSTTLRFRPFLAFRSVRQFTHENGTASRDYHMVDNGIQTCMYAGYPLFKCRARDTFIALPGLTLSIEETNYFDLVMKTAQKGLLEFIEGKPLSVHIYEMEQPDVPLWAVWCVQQYARKEGFEKCLEKYGTFVKTVVQFIERGEHPNLQVMENGLLFTNGKDKAVTWMNATVGGRPVIPRTGYIVEFNALWYNALKFCAHLAKLANCPDDVKHLEDFAAKVKVSFVDTFLNDYGYLYDYVGGNVIDWNVRPNMIFAVALDYSPLDQAQKKSVLDFCTRELLTPKGLRSLSPKSGGYNPMYVGTQNQRDLVYHQGTAWPWLGGFYMEACLKMYKRTRLSFIERQLVGYEDEMINHCVGTIPELFDGNPPFRGRGAISFAMNVAEILRTLELLERYNFKD